MYLKLGIDVGGTNTDAVILDDGNRLLGKAKSPTTRDVLSGIKKATAAVLQAADVDRERIRFAMLGTTQCINAILERKDLEKVAVIRLGAPATKAILPLFDWPEDLRRVVCHSAHVIEGGNEFDGRTLRDLDAEALRRIARDLRGRVTSVAVTSVFSPVRTEQEAQAREILHEVLGDEVRVTLSHEIGTVGLLERENATVLNAALLGVVRRAVSAFRDATREFGLRSELFLSQNDGTLMGIEAALRYPILTVSSGPTNSIRGAAYLAGLKDSIVVDIGGTSTDVGILKDGFPLESARAIDIGGVRTNFRMPAILSVGLGGGSLVRTDGGITVGPDSVGYRLTEEARVFGGTTLTTTDIAVGLGRANLGDRALLDGLPPELLAAADEVIRRRVEDAIEKTRLSPAPLPIVLVGGGSILLGPELQGASEVARPNHFEVANAIGAAIAEVGADVDTIVTYETRSRADEIARVQRLAIERAADAGADRSRIRIVNVEEIPITYLPGNAVRLRVKACGDLAT